MAFQERDEAKWQAFVVELCTLRPNLIVYVDESGMDNPDQYDYASESTPTTLPCAEIGAAPGSSKYDCSDHRATKNCSPVN